MPGTVMMVAPGFFCLQWLFWRASKLWNNFGTQRMKYDNTTCYEMLRIYK